MATKSRLKVGDQVTLRGTVTIPDGDERTGEGCVVVKVDGHPVPICLKTEHVGRTGRSERDGRYFLEDA